MSIAFTQKPKYKIDDLLKIVRLLRGEGGCPWDREQDHHSIRKNFIEETYEVVEAIDKNDTALLREELGDVLLQVSMHAQMETEAGHFNFDDVCDGICKKLIERHPHVFGHVKVNGTDDVLSNWDRIKSESKGHTTLTKTLDSVPAVLPALMRSQKVQQRAAKSGFDYHDAAQALEGLESEIRELREAMQANSAPQIREELGDLIFSAVNVSRLLHEDAEQALTESCEKFIRRFALVEQQAAQRGISLDRTNFETLNELWDKAKQDEQ